MASLQGLLNKVSLVHFNPDLSVGPYNEVVCSSGVAAKRGSTVVVNPKTLLAKSNSMNFAEVSACKQFCS